MIYNATNCLLGEGPLWHPGRGELFWFDILSRRLHSAAQSWDFEDFVSAAGWVDDETLLVATSRALVRFPLATGVPEEVVPMEADNPATRCNDGRADPQGGFWIGTMGLGAEEGAGSIYRYYRGELRQLYPNISIPNATCFAADGGRAYFADTRARKVWRVALDAEGWPVGEPETYIDYTDSPHVSDGAVIAEDGTFWTAQWGSSRVAVHDESGAEIAAHPLPASQTTCPAFGGPDLQTLYVTSASAGLSQDELAKVPDSGRTFALDVGVRGQAEHRVVL
ncbi:SMP-30/gluconolactonase/LRE family protein [Pseudoroseicyclus tamaricis]|uniref:SMP-30/gluconolactonase/LRE family protein n=1 Tax=Pseudoroseicyclus tamaricis TaxID=2705421 RepID=A0A6B2JTJ3_9RHOB|nr:SMP-30/gluconolactonase/LRE family protein [Pseudoroseicyclus tamaricis]NDV01877.1 SMP-30/gluconolactonase/LRE family protein [Pseudoroseicyclus tamaricis]